MIYRYSAKKEAIVFNAFLFGLVGISLFSSNFPRFAGSALIASLLIAILAPSAARLYARASHRLSTPEREQMPEGDEAQSKPANPSNTDALSGLEHHVIDVLDEEKFSAEHSDAFSQFIKGLEQRLEREGKTRTPVNAEDFSVTLSIINVYLGSSRSRSRADSGSLTEFILTPELHPSVNRPTNMEDHNAI